MCVSGVSKIVLPCALCVRFCYIDKRMPETDLHRHIAKGDNVAALAYVAEKDTTFLNQDVDVS
jgi:hypothetical protein